MYSSGAAETLRRVLESQAREDLRVLRRGVSGGQGRQQEGEYRTKCQAESVASIDRAEVHLSLQGKKPYTGWLTPVNPQFHFLLL